MQKTHVNDYLFKPRMQTARKLHKLYSSEHVDVPTVEDIILRHIRVTKTINNHLKDLIDEDSANADVMELCMLIDVDFEDIEPMHFESGGFNV
jgi:hypothetical protein